MRLERRAYVPLYLVVVAPLAAVAVALILAGVLIAAAGVSPATAYAEMLRGALGSRLSVTEMLTRATPLILTGLAAAVAFRARLWNIGGEGQFFVGALVTATAVPAMMAAACLLCVYALAIGINLARGRRNIDCGCTGPATRQLLSGWLLARNAGLVALAAIGTLASSGRALGPADWVVVGLGLAALITLYAAINQLMANSPRLDALDAVMESA